jgi:hypothetical protein
MAKWQVESGVAHGRGFSAQDPLGLCAKITSFMKRPAANGTPQVFTADAGTNNLSCAGHGYVTGDSVSFTTTGALPLPLLANTEYYVIYVGVDTFKLATSYYLAGIGTELDITTAGSGTNSVYGLGGGANWYVYDDLSDVTVKTFAPSDVDYTTNDTITITGHGLNTGRIVRITSTGTMPGGLVSGADQYVIYVDANTIKLASSYANAYNGTARNLVTTQGTGTHSLEPRDPAIIFCDTVSPVVNDILGGPSGGPPKFLKLSFPSSSGTMIYVMFGSWHDNAIHFTSGIWSGRALTTGDDTDFIYNIRGGDEGFWLHTLVGTTYYEVGWDEGIRISNLVEGSDKYGYLQSAASAGTSVVLQLASGEAANFTQNKHYYIASFGEVHSGGHRTYTSVQYVLVTNVNTGSDQITVSSLTYNFPIGTLIGAYPYAWIAIGTMSVDAGGVVNIGIPRSTIPLTSHYNAGVAGYAFHDQVSPIYASAISTIASNVLDILNPDDDGLQAVQRPLFGEYNIPNANVSGMNRAYMVAKNVYLAKNNTWLAGSYGKIINGKNYIFFKTAFDVIFNQGTTYAVLILDTESTT